jgi:hypothetical protein
MFLEGVKLKSADDVLLFQYTVFEEVTSDE